MQKSEVKKHLESRRKWQPTPVFLPGKSHGQRSLVGYSPWGSKVRHNWATSFPFFFLRDIGNKNIWNPCYLKLHKNEKKKKETPGVTGIFGLAVRNEAGQRLIEFCQENTLVIANTLFQQHKRRLYTWTSPDGQHRNQIDYILCRQRWRSSIQSVKTIPGADCGSDHELLIAKSDLNWRKWGKPLDHSGMTSIKSLMTIQWKWEIDLRN